MTTEHSTIAAEPFLTLVPQTPEERERTGRLHQQAYDNMEYLDEIFDDLLREHRGRLVAVYGDRQIMIGDDGYEMHESLTEEERETATFLPITEWWLRQCGAPE